MRGITRVYTDKKFSKSCLAGRGQFFPYLEIIILRRPGRTFFVHFGRVGCVIDAHVFNLGKREFGRRGQYIFFPSAASVRRQNSLFHPAPPRKKWRKYRKVTNIPWSTLVQSPGGKKSSNSRHPLLLPLPHCTTHPVFPNEISGGEGNQNLPHLIWETSASSAQKV